MIPQPLSTVYETNSSLTTRKRPKMHRICHAGNVLILESECNFVESSSANIVMLPRRKGLHSVT